MRYLTSMTAPGPDPTPQRANFSYLETGEGHSYQHFSAHKSSLLTHYSIHGQPQ